MKVFEIVNKNLLISVKSRPQEENKKSLSLPIITISREVNAGGLSTAMLLAKKLGKKWDFFDKDIVEKIALESKTSIDKVNEVDEKNAPSFYDFIENWFESNSLDLTKYHKNLIKVLCGIGQKGNVIIVGRGANFIFPDALNIRLICDKEQRIKWAILCEKISEKEARKFIEKADKERNEFIANLYNKDVSDPKYYDLVIKTGPYLSVKDAADLIARVAKKRFKL